MLSKGKSALRTLSITAVTFFLMAGTGYAVTTISADIVTDGNATLGDAIADIIQINGALTLEGTTADGFETTIVSEAAASDKTITLQNITGTLALLTDIEAADILAALLTVDTDESGLNADTVDSLEATALLLSGSGNNTTTISTNVSGTTNDYECASGTDCRYGSAGNAPVLFNAGNNTFHYADSTGTTRAALFLVNGYISLWAMVDGTTAWMTTLDGFVSGYRTNAAAAQRVSGVGESIASDGASSDIMAVFGAGLTGLEQPQTCDCGTTGTPNTVTCDIQSNVIHLIDGDADSCTVTLSTTTVDAIVTAYGATIVFPQITIIADNVGGGGTFDLADQAGVLELGTSFGMGVKDNLSLIYTSLTADEFQETGRTDL